MRRDSAAVGYASWVAIENRVLEQLPRVCCTIWMWRRLVSDRLLHWSQQGAWPATQVAWLAMRAAWLAGCWWVQPALPRIAYKRLRKGEHSYQPPPPHNHDNHSVEGAEWEG